ncbi:hypothetical protein [Streptomyces sp. NPDC006879]|uniref:hypothetical protein n=1 Tax=Streptomyces sp. NPDC006879 TaxID=3364767 RepID=UPI0036A04E86
MTKTKRFLTAVALAAGAAGIGAGSAAALPALPLPELPAAAPDMPAAAQPELNELAPTILRGASEANQLMDAIPQLTAPVQPVIDIASGLE